MNMNPQLLLQMFQSAKNPQAMFQNFLQQNPNARTMISQLQNASNGANPRDIAMQLAKQNNVDFNYLNTIHNTISH